jgi:hypothetical protein
LAALLAAGLVSSAAASDLRHHRAMTESALRELGWTDEAEISRVAQYSLAVDIGRIPEYTQAVLRVGLPAEVAVADELCALAETAPFSPRGTRGFHFAGLYRFSDIERRWRETEAWADWVAREIAACPSAETRDEARLLLLGLVAHAVQDFYCHSNWVGLLDDFTAGDSDAEEFPIWEELIANEGGWVSRNPAFDAPWALTRLRASDVTRSSSESEGGLQTGRPRTEPVLDAPVPWGHRHAGGQEMEVVHALGVRATALWVARLEKRMGEPKPAGAGSLARR